MFSGFEQAIVTSAVALFGIYLTQFLAEKYRRFNDGSAIAAGLLGELRSYKADHEKLEVALKQWISTARTYGKDVLPMKPIPKNSDPFFDSCVGRIGLIGDDLVTDTIFVYYRIRAAKDMINIVSDHFDDLSEAEFILYCESILDIIEKAANIGTPLLAKLEARSKAGFIC